MKKLIKSTLLAAATAMIPLTGEMKVVAFAGSLREESYNKKLIQEAAQIARDMGAKVTVIELKDYPLPFYNEDIERKEGLPKNAKKLQDLMSKSDAIIIATPEYNGSVPGVLKNVLDWVSRSGKVGYSPAAYEGKRFAIMSTSPGGGGGRRALANLRSIVTSAGGTVVQTEVAIPKAHEYFADKKRSENSELKKEIEELLQTEAVSGT